MPVVQCFPALTCRLIGVQFGAEEEAPLAPDLVKRLADEAYDCFLDFSHWPGVTSLAERLSGIPVRAVTVDPPQDALLGIRVDPERQALAFNRLVPVPSALHQHDKWRLLIRAALGIDIEPDWPLPARPMPPADQPLRVFLHPHAGKPGKIWPAERFAAAISQLGRRRRVHCSINRAKGSIVRALRWRLLLSRTTVDVLPLDPSFRSLQKVLENSDIAIGCDSGPMHFAALMGVPTLVIYGQFPAAEFAPPFRSTAISPADPQMPATAISTESVARALDLMLDDLSGRAA